MGSTELTQTGDTMHRIGGVLMSTVLLIYKVVDGVSITELSAPSIVEAGKELVLDCHFTYTDDQIISPEFKDLVDLTYTVEGEDRYTQYRALRIPSASLAVAGTYKCQVSSFTVESYKETQVNVFVPPTYMYVETSQIPTYTTRDRNSNVSESSPVVMSCRGGPAFPAPTLTLNWTQQIIGPLHQAIHQC